VRYNKQLNYGAVNCTLINTDVACHNKQRKWSKDLTALILLLSVAGNTVRTFIARVCQLVNSLGRYEAGMSGFLKYIPSHSGVVRVWCCVEISSYFVIRLGDLKLLILSGDFKLLCVITVSFFLLVCFIGDLCISFSPSFLPSFCKSFFRYLFFLSFFSPFRFRLPSHHVLTLHFICFTQQPTIRTMRSRRNSSVDRRISEPATLILK
jgi:hypothetical protein